MTPKCRVTQSKRTIALRQAVTHGVPQKHIGWHRDLFHSNRWAHHLRGVFGYAKLAAKIQTKAGDKINTATIKRDIACVRSLGFEDVRVDERDGVSGGKTIIFSVREKPPKPAQ